MDAERLLLDETYIALDAKGIARLLDLVDNAPATTDCSNHILTRKAFVA
jgi:uncharacterized protein (DUF1778 family)